jgi:tetratricopeptide (TPR) repeat protein
VAIAPLPKERSQEIAPEDAPRFGALACGTLLSLAALSVVYGALESRLWADPLWGAHFYAFFPPNVLIVAAGAALSAIAAAALLPGSWIARPVPALSRNARIGIAVIAALLASFLFWTYRERHLFWGDALPLSIDVRKGLAFHPDEPLTMFVHHVLYRLGGGKWSGATAVAIGSTLAGTLFVGLALFWLLRRGRDPWAGALAALALFSQGFMTLFFGHVENYSYLAVALLVFFLSGVDFLEGRAGPWVPAAAAVTAYAFHILGGLVAIPAAVLIAAGLRETRRRWATVGALVGAVALLGIGAFAVRGLYGDHRSPLDGVISGAARVLGNAADMQTRTQFSTRHWANVWSEYNLLGPLSIVWLVIVAALLKAPIRGRIGVFLLLGAATLLMPSLLTGEGNLGAARNWDLFAAPALTAPLAGLTLLLERLDVGQARRLMLALAAASLFHTVPWIAINTDLDRTIDRIAHLPLTNGRGQTMIGTHFLNDGQLKLAEHWFRLALERDFDNANAQSGLGLALARQGRLREARGPMIAATQLRPGVVTYQDDLITLFLTLHEWEEASAVLRDRLAVEPNDAESWKTLAQLRARVGDPDGAVEVLEEGCRRMPAETSLQVELGNAYVWAVVQHGRRQEWSLAHAQLDRFATAFPGDPRVRRLRDAVP